MSSRRRSRGTVTANFGSGRREGHDASAFYQRFTPPQISSDDNLNPAGQLDVIHHGDARRMDAVASNSVALVVTSPPYFAGKQYEEELGVDGVPADYFEYLQLLSDVFEQCVRVLEPGGRIAVNVANLGRRPYRSLSGDVTEILQDLGLLLRGEVIWWKGRAAGGSCAWGSFQSPANPVLRDVTERIVIASKGRFDRALNTKERAAQGLPSTVTLSREEFMEATTDLWEISPERARRVGHPAPFPVDLPHRLIDLYTYKDDTVLDPFMGSGSTAVAAVRSGRRYIGFDTDSDYVRIAEDRIQTERARSIEGAGTATAVVEVSVSPPDAATDGAEPEEVTGDSGADQISAAVKSGRQAKEIAEILLQVAGFENIRSQQKVRGAGVVLDFVATDRRGCDWAFLVTGVFSSTDMGLRRGDTLWRTLGTAAVLAQSQILGGTNNRDGTTMPLVLMTTQAPNKGTDAHRALSLMRGPGLAVFDVVELLDPLDRSRLECLAHNGPTETP